MRNRNPARTDDRTFDVFGVIKIGEVKADSWYEAKHKAEALSNCVVPFKPIKSFVEERVTYDKSKQRTPHP